jgi:hypothetical protein
MASNVMVGVAPGSDVDRVEAVLGEVFRQAVADKVPGVAGGTRTQCPVRSGL